MNPVIKVMDAAFRYGRQLVFSNISFSLSPGEVFCLVGPNGCGKTTLLDCVLGILKLQNGRVLLQGKDVRTMGPSDVASLMAYVPQVHHRTFPYTVMDIVLMGRARHIGMFSSPSPSDVHICEQALELIGLASLRDRPYTQLSGGQCQLVMIARALAQQTPVIIMDEPTAHLDFRHELIVLETIVHLVRETGTSIVMATHFPNHAFYLENQGIDISLALMSGTGFSEVGRPQEVLSEQNLRAIYNIDVRIAEHHLDNSTKLQQIIPVRTLNGPCDEEKGAGSM